MFAAAPPAGQPVPAAPPLTLGSYRMVYDALAQPPFRLIPRRLASDPPSPPQGQAQGFDQISVKAFDPINNALRINATLSPGGSHTPTNADQVFTSTFDSGNNAVRVNCVVGCGSSVTFKGDLGGSPASQTVMGLEGHPLAATTPATNQLLTWNGTAWAPTTPASGAGTGVCSANQFVTGVNLGTIPNCVQPAFSGLSGTVSPAQLPPATSSAQGGVQLTQDLAGSAATPKVAGLQGNPVSGAIPAANQVLTWNGTTWAPATPPAGAGSGACGTNQFVIGVNLGSSPNCTQPAFSSLTGAATSAQLPAASAAARGGLVLAQDLTGTATAPKVAGLQGNPVSSTAPTANQVLTWNGTTWVPTTPTAGAGTGACGANQFVSGVNLGSSPNCTQPAFASLSGTATAAQLPAASSSAQGALQLAQDLTGSAVAPKVAGLQGNPVLSTTPTSNQILTWNGTAWTPANAPATGAQVAQDLGGTTAAPKVVGLQGSPVSSAAPTANQVLTWNGTTWVPTTPTAGAGTGACGANQFITSVVQGSSPNCTQPTFSSLTGTATSAQLPPAISSAQGAVQLTQDLAGNAAAPVVAGLQGNPVSSMAPTPNQVLTWNGTTWAPANATMGAQVAQDLGGSTAAPKVVGLQGNPISSAPPTSGQCLSYNGTQWAPLPCASGAGTAGGSTSQVQFNSSGALGGATNFTYNTTTGSVSIQPAPTKDAVPLTLSPGVVTPSSDVFDVFKDSGRTTKAIWVDSSGNFNGNTATYGQASQTSQSYLKVYGGTAGPGYLQSLSNTGSVGTYIFGSATSAGTACESTNVPNGSSTCGGGAQLMPNPNVNEYWVGPGYLYSTMDPLIETLPSGNYTIHDVNCSGTNGVGDDWTVDPFNPTSGINLHLVITYGPCKYPLATEVPLAIGQSSSLTLLGLSGKLAGSATGGVMMPGPTFSPGPIAGAGPTPSVTATTTGCGGNTFGSTTVIDVVATYVQNIKSGGNGVDGQTVIGAAQTNVSIPAGSCASYTVPTSLPTNAAGVSLFATLHSNPGAYAWQVTGGSAIAITFPTSGGASASLNTSNPSPPGFNTSGAVIYLGRRNENALFQTSQQFGAVFSGFIDANAKANYCLVNVGAQEMSGAFGAHCENPLGPAGILIEGFNGSITSNNSSVGRLDFDTSTCTATTPCGGYPGAGPITAAQEPSIAPLIIDQVSSFRGADDVTCTPNSASAPTLYSCVLIVGTTFPEAGVASHGASLARVHAEGASSGTNIIAAVKACGAQIEVTHLTNSSKNGVDVDDLSSSACQAAAPNSFTATPVSQPSYADISDILPYSGQGSAVVDHTTGYTSTAGAPLAHYWAGGSPTLWASSNTPLPVGMGGTNATESCSAFDLTCLGLNQEFCTNAGTNANATGFSLTQIVGTTSSTAQANPTTNFPCGIQVNTQAVLGDGASFTLGSGNSLGSLGATSASWDSYWIASPGAAGPSTLGARWGFGTGGSTTAIPPNGFYLRYDTSLSDTTYQFCVDSSSTETCSNTAVTPAANTFVALRIANVSSGKISFSLYNAANKLVAGPTTFCASGCTLNTAPPSAGVTAYSSVVSNAASTSARITLEKFSFIEWGLVR
jgi:hypothetical protein